MTFPSNNFIFARDSLKMLKKLFHVPSIISTASGLAIISPFIEDYNYRIICIAITVLLVITALIIAQVERSSKRIQERIKTIKKYQIVELLQRPSVPKLNKPIIQRGTRKAQARFPYLRPGLPEVNTCVLPKDYESYLYDLIKSIERSPEVTAVHQPSQNTLTFRKICLSLLDLLGIQRIQEAKRRDLPQKTIKALEENHAQESRDRREKYKGLIEPCGGDGLRDDGCENEEESNENYISKPNFDKDEKVNINGQYQGLENHGEIRQNHIGDTQNINKINNILHNQDRQNEGRQNEGKHNEGGQNKNTQDQIGNQECQKTNARCGEYQRLKAAQLERIQKQKEQENCGKWKIDNLMIGKRNEPDTTAQLLERISCATKSDLKKKLYIQDEIEFLKMFDDWIRSGRKQKSFIDMLDMTDDEGSIKKQHYAMFLLAFFDNLLKSRPCKFEREELEKLKEDFFTFIENGKARGSITPEEKCDIEDHFLLVLARKQNDDQVLKEMTKNSENGKTFNKCLDFVDTLNGSSVENLRYSNHIWKCEEPRNKQESEIVAKSPSLTWRIFKWFIFYLPRRFQPNFCNDISNIKKGVVFERKVDKEVVVSSGSKKFTELWNNMNKVVGSEVEI